MRVADGRRCGRSDVGPPPPPPTIVVFISIAAIAAAATTSAWAFSSTTAPLLGPGRRPRRREVRRVHDDGASALPLSPRSDAVVVRASFAGGTRSIAIATLPFLSRPSSPALIVEESRVERRLDDDDDDDDGATIVLAARSSVVDGGGWRSCGGCLVRNDDGRRFEACVRCAFVGDGGGDDDGGGGGGGDVDVDAAVADLDMDVLVAAYHRLLLHYLRVERESYEEERDAGGGRRVRPRLTPLAVDFDGGDDDPDGGAECRRRRLLLDRLVRIGILLPSSQFSSYGGDDRAAGDDGDDDNSSISNDLAIDLQRYLPFLNEHAFRCRGTDAGIDSLEVLRMLSARRVTFDFGATDRDEDDDDDDGGEQRRGKTGGGVRGGGRRANFVSRLPGILPPGVVDDVVEIVGRIKSKNWLSANPDSVDGLPSLHLNLIAGGRSMFEYDDPDPDPDDEDEDDPGEDDVFSDEGGMSFPRCISRMTNILRPYLYDTLLPAIREISNSHTVEISDVFLRNYGKKEEVGRRPFLRDDDDDDIYNAKDGDGVGDGNGDDDDDDDDEDRESVASAAAAARFVLSPHYDVTAYATCVIALDSTASTGRNGLYVMPRRRSSSPRGGVAYSSSAAASVGHAALRQFFALEVGDGVAHSYDVLHGVDVDPDLGRERTSLIVWFVDDGDGRGEGGDCGRGGVSVGVRSGTPPSWLLDPDDDVAEFVLGLAFESSSSGQGGRGANTTTPPLSDRRAEFVADPYPLYLSSARKGNIYAMSAIAQMCSDGIIPRSQYDRILDLLTSVHVGGAGGGSSNPLFFGRQQRSDDYGVGDDLSSWEGLAIALWYHAAIRGGHRAAQVSLADEIMSRYYTSMEEEGDDGDAEDPSSDDDRRRRSSSSREDMLLAASVLFTMAHSQGHVDSRGSLKRLMDVEIDRLIGSGVGLGGGDDADDGDDSLLSPVMRILLMTI
jgi:hypothetical protein